MMRQPMTRTVASTWLGRFAAQHNAPTLASRVTEALLLRKAAAIRRCYRPEQYDAIRRLHQMAQVRLSLADDTTDERFAEATLPLYREAIQCLIAALQLAHDPAATVTPAALTGLAEQLEALARKNCIPSLPRDYSSVLGWLGEPLSTPSRNLQPSAAERRIQLERLAHWLNAHVQARSRGEIWTARTVRLSIAAAAVIGGSIWTFDALFAPSNWALNKPVTMSGRYPGTPDPQGATDGKIVGPYQAHTPRQDDPWIAVDLGRIVPVGRVEIHNRTDGLYADALPLILELSQDGSQFEPVDRRTRSFTGSRPWIYKAPARLARIIRVHGHQSGYVVVTEIKAYER